MTLPLSYSGIERFPISSLVLYRYLTNIGRVIAEQILASLVVTSPELLGKPNFAPDRCGKPIENDYQGRSMGILVGVDGMDFVSGKNYACL